MKKILNLGEFEYVWKTDEAEKNLLERKQEQAKTAKGMEVAEEEERTKEGEKKEQVRDEQSYVLDERG